MRDGEAIIRAGGIVAGLTIKVKGLGGAMLRLRLARFIFRFGAIVAGCAVEIAMDDQRDEI